MVHLTFGGQKIIAQPYPQGASLEQAIQLKHYRHEPEFFFHYHPYHELCLRTGTKGERLVGNTITPYGETDLVLLGPNLPHTWASHSGTNGNNVENYVIHFSTESLGVEMLSKPELRHIRIMLDRAQQGICFSKDHVDAISDEVRKLPDLSPAQRFVSMVSILDRLASHDGHTFLVNKEYEITWSENDSVLFQRALDYIWANHTNQFNRQDIARHVGLSVSTFSRFFKRMTGKTLVSYVNELKIRRASELLLSRTDSILDISFMVGYQNCSYFNKQFKATTGMTPVEYRKLNGKS